MKESLFLREHKKLYLESAEGISYLFLQSSFQKKNSLMKKGGEII